MQNTLFFGARRPCYRPSWISVPEKNGIEWRGEAGQPSLAVTISCLSPRLKRSRGRSFYEGVRGVPATAPVTTTQYARRLPVPTASPKGPNDSCRVVGVAPRAQLDAAESRAAASGMAAVLASSARGRDPQPPQGSRTPEASRRVQRALLKLELPDWFRQHYRPPRRDHLWLGDDGVAPQWPKWRALPAKEAKQPTGFRPAQTAETSLPADRRNLVIPKRVTFREKSSSRSSVRPWVYRSLRTPYLGWRSAGLATATAAQPQQQQATVR
ncbi:hypothetical protein HPB50_006710 [Hyalomma asiaticum]|uniref:Uncharacterized protein n=1 Tax=Hyalomma asiaticum TaxID=266040 RepID=A0ACB7TG35_HYAAI|nr:hypothetical protein HPB50_006710 [Hyalomma asiaticum]